MTQYMNGTYGRTSSGIAIGRKPTSGTRRLLDFVDGAFDRLQVWQDRARERRALRELSDSMLKDIGISRVDANREATKPFWRS